MRCSFLVAGLVATFMAGSACAQAELDTEAAEKLLKRNDCFKCHAIDKDKRAPAYKKVAARLRARSYGVDYVIKHVTTGPTVRLEDGTEEQHRVIDTTDRAELENLARWLLALK
ncbi:MAG: cytochrome C [Rhodocyclales bacterium]|nr:cytochrome C [Rhodocyclales bacterium]